MESPSRSVARRVPRASICHDRSSAVDVFATPCIAASFPPDGRMDVFECAFAGYRSLRRIRFPLRRLNVFVGDNGVGKTNLYRALQLLQAAAIGTLGRELATEGGMESASWAGERRKHERPAIELEVGLGEH